MSYINYTKEGKCSICGAIVIRKQIKSHLTCKICKRDKYRETERKYRKLTNNKATHKYEKTKSGFLMRLYRNMKSRITGIQWKKAHLYKGKELLPKNDFYKWAWNNKTFQRLFMKWEKSNYNRKLTPTVNRINPQIGYVLENMEWLTHSENSALSNHSRKLKI